LKANKETKETKIDFHLAAVGCPMLFACFTFGSLSGFSLFGIRFRFAAFRSDGFYADGEVCK